LAGWPLRSALAEPPPETPRIRIASVPTVCLSPQYVAAELLRGEGFSDVEYVTTGPSRVGGVPGAKAQGEGQYDIGMNFAGPLVVALDEGAPIVLLAGVHVGCFELVATRRVLRITDLKDKTVAVFARGSAPHIFLASIATSVGLDPNRDIRWDDRPVAESMQLLAEGSIDAMLAFPPDAQELRAKGVGHVILKSTVDRPWSQYFCCLVAANRQFTQRYPAATKRAVRAILKASEICAADPERAVNAYLAQGFAAHPQFVDQAMRELPFGKWREYNPEETVRFYALRLREAGMVNGTPQKLIAQGTDWRYLNELKRELKA
jgi:NitT/TauT family transport system substrate-binding protein